MKKRGVETSNTAEIKTSVSKNLNEMTMQYEKDRKVLTKLYLDVFQANPAGQKILADLAMRFYDRPSVLAGEPEHMTFVREGERTVLLYIIQKCAEAQQ